MRWLTIGLMWLSAIVVVVEAAATPTSRGEGPAIVLDRLVAMVADHPITLSDIRVARLLDLVPEGEETAAVVDRLIDRELMRIEVDRFAVAEPPAKMIDTRLARLRQERSTPGAFAAAVARSSLTVAQVRAVLRDEIRIATYLEQRFASTAADRRAEDIDEWVANLRRRTEITVVSGQ